MGGDAPAMDPLPCRSLPTMRDEPEVRPDGEEDEPEPFTLGEYEHSLVMALEGVSRIARHLSNVLLRMERSARFGYSITELKSIEVFARAKREGWRSTTRRRSTGRRSSKQRQSLFPTKEADAVVIGLLECSPMPSPRSFHRTSG
jgi:hypothetical protein